MTFEKLRPERSWSLMNLIVCFDAYYASPLAGKLINDGWNW